MQESISWNGVELSIETGNWAKQAHGAVVYRHGKLVLLATVCAEKEAREGQDFFPLTVDYREKTYAVGKIPGGYIKRESRPAEHETLISRLIDRPIRPLFPEGYFCEVQLLVTVLSADPEKTIEGHAITAASAALAVSDIPFLSPVAGVVVGYKDGAFVADPDSSVVEEGDLELVVAGTRDAVMMIEGAAKEVSAEFFIQAIDFAHQKIKEKIVAQERLVEKLNVKKREVELHRPDEELRSMVREFALEKLRQANRNPDKKQRNEAIEQVNRAALDFIREKLANDPGRDSDAALREVKAYLHELEYIVVRDLIFSEGIRADGRRVDEIRNISIELDVLPAAHGSAVFTRGQTQSLGVVTLGTGDDYQRIEFLSGEQQKNFMLHYNFPPFSTGEVKRMAGPGRREIGHGNLAERALRAVVPSKAEFPYVIRVVSEILESNGSSSMASVCSGSMALMAAGVPVKAQVAGIAMGLIMGDDGRYVILSDIAGIEDHFGDMDFKVAGTEKGITAFQLDIKIAGLSVEILRDALAQAERGRMYILRKMNEAISTARPAVPDNAPLVMTMHISPDRIGELIGPGGKIIRSIIERSRAELNVEDDGTVTIAAMNRERAEHAKRLIEDIFREVEVGQVYRGVVKRITDFGAFVEIFPGKDGLLHISKMSKNRIQSVKEVMDVGTEVTVAVLGVDSLGRVNLILKDLVDSHPPESDAGREDRSGDRDHRGARGGRDRSRRH
jgi:polyribonucleotide nucleotidyltransferase